MKKKNKSIKKDNWGYVFIAPFFLTFFIFNLYSIFYTFRISFFSWDGFSDPIWIGLKNYQQLFQDHLFWQGVRNTIIFALGAGILQIGSGLILAYVLNQRFVKFPNALKCIYYFPNLVTAVSMGILFKLLFAWKGGSVNFILENLHLIDSSINWLNNKVFTQGLVIFIVWFQCFGYYIIIFTAGIKGISEEILDAAAIDGASKVQTFTGIVLPLLKPVIVYAATMMIIGGFQMFDMPFALGGSAGHPGGSTLTITGYMYMSSFQNGRYGYGAAISYGMLALILIFCIFYMHQYLKQEGETSK